MASSSTSTRPFVSLSSRFTKATIPSGQFAPLMSFGLTAQPFASPQATLCFTWPMALSISFPSTSPWLCFSSPTLPSHFQPLNSSPPKCAISKCASPTLLPSATTPLKAALPQSTRSSANSRTLSLLMTSSQTTWSLCTNQDQTWRLVSRQSLVISALWLFSGGLVVAHSTLQSWMVQSPSFTMLHFVLSQFCPAHK